MSPHPMASFEEPRLTENAQKVLEARYLKKNEAGELEETGGQLFRRVAHAIAAVETQYGATESERRHWEERFYDLMVSGGFMPNSPTLMNAGREMGMLSACFVLPVRDSIVDIFDSIKHTALIQKAGGGTGFAFDELRPTGDYIASSGGTTSGPITFWRAFSEATNAIQQGAFRRGANMGMMYIHHPDILKFLHAKQDLSQFTNYNISVKVTDVWMEEFLVDPDSPHVVRNPRTGAAFVIPRDLDIWKYDIRSLIPASFVQAVSPSDPERYYATPRISGKLPEELRGKVYTKRDIWQVIIRNAWQTGEPGVVYIDRINEHNPTPHVGRIEATNPCGEQPLLPFEACNLGSVNLGLFVVDACTPRARVDWDALKRTIHVSTRFLDNVIDANNYPLDEIDRICKANRKIGLGIMGFADALYKLGVPYNSDEGVAWGERFMKFVNDHAHNYSEHLARVRGPFPNWTGSIWQTRYNRLMRNSATTTVAPTGTISIIANCSGGVEPMFSLAFIRNVLRGQKQGEKPLVEVNDVFRQVAKARGFYSDQLMEQVAAEGTLAHIEGVPDDIKRVFVCAHDITPEWHMKMQAGFQRHCDSSISKTINFPEAATAEEVDTIYRLAYELDCKGVTVYRDNCRAFQPMALKKDTAANAGQTVDAKAAKPAPSAPAENGAEARQSISTISADAISLTAEALAATEAAPQPVRVEASYPESAIAPDVDDAADLDFPALDLHPDEPADRHSGPSASADDSGAPIGASLDAPIASSDAGLRPAARLERAAPEVVSPQPAARPATSAARTPPPLEPRDLPEIVSGLRIRQLTPFGNMHVKITVDPRSERELEVFAQLGKGGDVATSDLEAICRMISLWLRAGGSIRQVIKQLEGIGSSLQIPTRAGRIMSLGDGLACSLKKYLRAKERFGLRPLLLGEVDPSDMDNPAPPPHGHAVMDRAPAPVRPAPPITPAPRVKVDADASPRLTDPVRSVDPGVSAASSAERLSARPAIGPSAGHAGSSAAGSSPAHSRASAPAPEADAVRIPRFTRSSGNGGSAPRASLHAENGHAGYAAPALDVDAGDLPLTELESAAQVETATATLEAMPESLASEIDALFHEDLADLAARQANVNPSANGHATAGATNGHAAPDLEFEVQVEQSVYLVSEEQGVAQVAFRHEHDSAAYYAVKCPECAGRLALEEGCRKCYGCGWSAC